MLFASWRRVLRLGCRRDQPGHVGIFHQRVFDVLLGAGAIRFVTLDGAGQMLGEPATA